jgi:hypothetical protein
MDLKQGGRSMHEYSKLFNHLAQYAPDQVDTDEKKKDHFMNGLLIKLHEHLTLSMGGTFPDFVSNAIIVDDKIHAHKESQKRKVVATSSNSAPPAEVLGGVPPSSPHLPAVLAAAVGSPATLASAPAGHMKCSTSTTTSDAPARTTKHYIKFWQRLLQLWSDCPFCS